MKMYCMRCVHQDLQNQLKKLSGELGARESERSKEQDEELEESKRREHTHESSIQRLTHTLTYKEQQLQVCSISFTSTRMTKYL